MKTLYHNGQFVPMTSEDDTFEALLVADDGAIAFTGSLVEARERAEDASEIDLAGKTVLPGFIDGHSHFTGTTQYLLNPDLSACRSFADIQNVLRDFIQKRGIDENGVVMPSATTKTRWPSVVILRRTCWTRWGSRRPKPRRFWRVDRFGIAQYAGRRCIRLNEKAHMKLCRVAAPRMIADEASHGAEGHIHRHR